MQRIKFISVSTHIELTTDLYLVGLPLKLILKLINTL